VAILLVATGAAIVKTQDLRDQGPVVSSTKLKTRRDGGYRVCFRLTRDDIVAVAVVNAADQEVRVLARAAQLSGSDSAPDTPKAGAHCFDWDGTDAAGVPVPAGIYRMRLGFESADRVLIPGEHVTIAVRGAPS
jgi:hypothetical protein